MNVRENPGIPINFRLKMTYELSNGHNSSL